VSTSRAQVVPPHEIDRVEREDGPPEPPPTTPRVGLPLALRLGLPVIVVPVLLAVLGAFDPHPQVAHGRAGDLGIRVEAPDRARQNERADVSIELANDGDEPLAAFVAISPEYVDAFVDASMMPAPDRAWAAHLAEIPPGATRTVVLALRADRAGAHHGVVRVRTDGGQEDRIEISTFVFP
jgi:hypothetical protein